MQPLLQCSVKRKQGGGCNSEGHETIDSNKTVCLVVHLRKGCMRLMQFGTEPTL